VLEQSQLTTSSIRQTSRKKVQTTSSCPDLIFHMASVNTEAIFICSAVQTSASYSMLGRPGVKLGFFVFSVKVGRITEEFMFRDLS
jgi:hypothetical protein